MNVRELIEELQRYDSETEVMVSVDPTRALANSEVSSLDQLYCADGMGWRTDESGGETVHRVVRILPGKDVGDVVRWVVAQERGEK